MANTKEYKIVINGIDESVKAVDALNKELSTLESRIKALEGKSVGVKSSGGGSTSSKSSLSEEEKIAKQIEQIDAKREAYSKEIYQNYLAAKDVLKETVKDQNAIAASERLQAKTYSNTIMGMKQELADIKSAMQTVDLGDTDQLDKMTKRANELNDALKKIEESYGQFGRNVGNYASAFDKYTIKIGDNVREFNSATEASKKLKNELLKMPKGAKGVEELHEALLKIQSDIKDLGKSSSVMDNLLDTMESFTAIANVGQGIKGLFGVDDAEMQKSIKNLVALQNVLKGIETINKQIKTGEGVGGWIKPFNTQIDKAIVKLTAFEGTLKKTTVASKALAVGINLATKALKVFKTALSFGILLVLDLVLEKVLDLVEGFKKVDKEAEATKQMQEEMSEAYGKAMATLVKYENKVKNFNGTKKQEKDLVKELNTELGKTLGTYKTLGEWMDALSKKGKGYVELLKEQAKAQAAFNLMVRSQQEIMKHDANNPDDKSIEEYSKWYDALISAISGYGIGDLRKSRKKESKDAWSAEADELKKGYEKWETVYLEASKKADEIMKQYGLGDYSTQIENGTTKTAEAIDEAGKTLMDLTMRLMKEGLAKRLKELDNEKNETIAKLKKNAKTTSDQLEKIEKAYSDIRIKEIKSYLQTLDSLIKDSANKISEIKFNLNIKDIDLQIDEIERKILRLKEIVPNEVELLSDVDVAYELANVNQSKLDIAFDFENVFAKKDVKTDVSDGIENLYAWLDDYISEKEPELREKLKSESEKTSTDLLEQKKAYYNSIIDLFEDEYAKELNIIRSYGFEETDSLSNSLDNRLRLVEKYNDKVLEEIQNEIRKEEEANKTRINLQEENDRDAEKKRFDSLDNRLKDEAEALATSLKNIKVTNAQELESYFNLKDKLNDIAKQIEDNKKVHEDKLTQISKDAETNRIKVTTDSANKIKDIEQKKFEERLKVYSDYIQKAKTIESNQPTYDSVGFGVVNIVATQKKYDELRKAGEIALGQIEEDLNKVQESFEKGLITPAAKEATIKNLNEDKKAIEDNLRNIDKSSKETVGKFIQSLNQYAQALGQSLMQIMSAVWDAQDVQFEKEQEYLDKLNEELDKKLDEQEEIVQKHKDAIDSIEDELADSRGARRQHLIDQINAEMEAQRAAQKQEQRIAKEKEAAQKKQDALELKRKKAEYKRNLLQAIVNGALAVTMAAVNNWPVPAIPMMALAAATTAAEIAVMTSNKPYAKGGVLEGPSHKQGGIPVGNTGIEVEGKEYVVRKKSTTPNIQLLDYINRSERKLSLDDFIDFYSSGKLKNNISSISPKRTFADGGTIPTITNDYAFDDRLLSAFEDYSNRPVYVSVVDINNRQDAVKNVQVLAGLSD